MSLSRTAAAGVTSVWSMAVLPRGTGRRRGSPRRRTGPVRAINGEVVSAGGVGFEDGERVRPFSERGVAGRLPNGVSFQAAHLREGLGCLRQDLAVDDEATGVV